MELLVFSIEPIELIFWGWELLIAQVSNQLKTEGSGSGASKGCWWGVSVLCMAYIPETINHQNGING